MTNKEIAKTFQLLGDIMELHGENSFKIRSYQQAYLSLRKWEKPLSEMSREEINEIKGVGKAIGDKIVELLTTGQLNTLEKYRSMTPAGVQEIIAIPGIGPKKTALIWKELGVESVGELLYAIQENRLAELKGFGNKTQDDIRDKLEYYQRAQGKYHFAALDQEAQALLNALQQQYPDTPMCLVGELARCANIVSHIDILIGREARLQEAIDQGLLQSEDLSTRGTPLRLYYCRPEAFGGQQFTLRSGAAFAEYIHNTYPTLDTRDADSELVIFERAGLPFVAPELRDLPESLAWAQAGKLPQLIEDTDIKGVIHTHTTYSDGLHSLAEMCAHAQSLGYTYIGITDHSKAAFYAQGLEPERVLMQWREIDALNEAMGPDFHIFKGIESDILNDGSLDYPEDILAGFDFIIASVHSNLRMDEEKATRRLLRAIENPFTTILGHPTGRLLLSRPGYPIHHQLIIDACAANGVAIELNASPWRLDLDWTWIPYAMERGVLISVNPDAHSREGIKDIYYGVRSARKGGLTAAGCLNTLTAEMFLKHCKSKR